MSVDDLGVKGSTVVREVAQSRRHAVITDHGQPVAAIVPLGDEATAFDELAIRLGQRGVFARHRPEGRSAVDELLAERRAEAAREDAS